jgi:hypothetical protein
MQYIWIFQGLSLDYHQGDSALGVGGGGSAPTPPKCRLKGLRNVGLWASSRLRLMIAVLSKDNPRITQRNHRFLLFFKVFLPFFGQKTEN